MRFTQWILDLEDEDGALDKFHKAIYSDINNGCGSSKYDALAWKAHFEERHADTAKNLINLLSVAYAQYVLRTNAK